MLNTRPKQNNLHLLANIKTINTSEMFKCVLFHLFLLKSNELVCFFFASYFKRQKKLYILIQKENWKEIKYQHLAVQIAFQRFQTKYPLQEVQQGEANTMVALKRVGPSSSSWLASGLGKSMETRKRLATIEILPFRLYQNCVNNPRDHFPRYLNY